MTMANPPASVAGDSDYGDFGSDVEELEILDLLLSQADLITPATVDIEDYEQPQSIRLPKVLGYEARPSSQRPGDSQVPLETVANGRTKDGTRQSVERDSVPPEADNRSPLERFRKPPKKALSVTDLISPSWCELQYFYTLTKHGRKRRTPAMKQGTAVHQALEDEVHTIVPIEITKKEDGFGLRIWNIIQGLRTLRDTGRTREIEVWGTIGGELVNGIIDELSYECPDPNYEANMRDSKVELPEYQTSITDYLLAAGQKQNIMHDGGSIDASLQDNRVMRKRKWIYITDVKTRSSPSLPSGSSLRPTILQLHLYHHLLENLAQGNFPLSRLADRYNLNINETFSDSFLAQLGTLNQDLFTAASSQEEQLRASQIMSSQDSMEILLQHNNLTELWKYMMSQFRLTFFEDHLPLSQLSDRANAHISSLHEPPISTPQSVADLPQLPDQPTLLSPLLTAEYLAPTYKHIAGKPKNSLGSKSFGFNTAFLRSYLEENLAWWRGEREARGVELQEAWKCRSCDFRTDCRWIHERDEAALKEALERKRMREIAGVGADEHGQTGSAKPTTSLNRSKV